MKKQNKKKPLNAVEHFLHTYFKLSRLQIALTTNDNLDCQ